MGKSRPKKLWYPSVIRPGKNFPKNSYIYGHSEKLSAIYLLCLAELKKKAYKLSDKTALGLGKMELLSVNPDHHAFAHVTPQTRDVLELQSFPRQPSSQTHVSGPVHTPLTQPEVQCAEKYINIICTNFFTHLKFIKCCLDTHSC